MVTARRSDERGTDDVSTTETTTQEAGKAEPGKCRAVKRGGVDLHCTEDEDHDRGPDATWHKAVYNEHREIAYDGAHHVVDMTERVTWEPADQVAEAVRKFMKDRA